jgi:hypothetical protein
VTRGRKPGSLATAEARRNMSTAQLKRHAALRERRRRERESRQGRTEVLALIARFELIVERPGEDYDWQCIARKTVQALKELLELRKAGTP